MNKTEKQQEVESLKQAFRELKTVLIVEYKGLKVPEATELRRQVRKSKGHYRVVKNTLAVNAAKGTIVEKLSDHFSGPTALAYTSADSVALAKTLVDFARTVPSLSFRAGLVEGQAVTAAQISDLTKLPSRQELISKLLFLLKAPATRLVTVLNAPVRNLAVVLAQIKKDEAQK